MSEILISSKNLKQSPEKLKIYYNRAFEFDHNYEIALTKLDTFYSIPNLSDKYDNNYFKYYDGEKWDKITFPKGIYEVDTLNDYLKLFFDSEKPPIQFDVNLATGRFVIRLKENYEIDFNQGKFNEVLGFQNKKYKGKIIEGEYKGNITFGVDKLLIHCSIADGANFNGIRSDIIYNFKPISFPYGAIIERPNPPQYFPLNKTRFNEIVIEIKDEHGRQVDLNGEDISYVLNIRRKNEELMYELLT